MKDSLSVFAVLTLVLSSCAPARTSPNNGAAGMGGMVGTDADTGGAATVLGGPVDISGVYDARHVGTLSAGSKHVREHIIIRSGDLYELADAGCASLEALKVASIIDLRDEPDLSNRPDRDCGIAERKLVQLSLPKLLPPSADSYLATLDAAEAKLTALFSALAQANGPVLIHCVIGRDRATLITSLVLLAIGVDEATVLADATSNQDPSVVVDAAWFTGVTSRIHDAGGIELYLIQHGVQLAQIEELRAEMTL